MSTSSSVQCWWGLPMVATFVSFEVPFWIKLGRLVDVAVNVAENEAIAFTIIVSSSEARPLSDTRFSHARSGGSAPTTTPSLLRRTTFNCFNTTQKLKTKLRDSSSRPL
jgi:hypothetical protein